MRAVMEDSVIDVRTHERDAIESGSSVKSSQLRSRIGWATRGLYHTLLSTAPPF